MGMMGTLGLFLWTVLHIAVSIIKYPKGISEVICLSQLDRVFGEPTTNKVE